MCNSAQKDTLKKKKDVQGIGWEEKKGEKYTAII